MSSTMPPLTLAASSGEAFVCRGIVGHGRFSVGDDKDFILFGR